MTSVEVNGSFYSLQRPTSYARWRDATPDDFVFAVKGSRFITHMKQLADVDVPLANFWASGVLALGPKLGPVLWQLPARTRFDAPRLAEFFDRLPRSTSEAAGLARGHDEKVPESRALVDALDERPIQHVLEARHASFATRRRRSCCGPTTSAPYGPTRPESSPSSTRTPAGAGTCACTGIPSCMRVATARGRWTSGPSAARTWAAAGRDVYVYFDNDIRGRAPWDAVGLLARLRS